MSTGRIQMLFGLIAVGVCLVSAQRATDNPETYVDHNNGVETSIPGTTVPRDVLPTPRRPVQPVPNFVYNSNSFLQNGAGTIFKGPDGRTTLIGAGGQTIVTSEEDSDEETSSGFHSNVVINGRNIGGQGFHSSDGGILLVNQGGEGSYQTYNNHQLRIVNGGLQLSTAGKVYDFPAKDASVKTRETVDINGQQATVDYENGNIVVELADGTVFAKSDGGLFSGNRQSYENRKQIQEDAIRTAANVQAQAVELQKQLQLQLQEQMRSLQEELQRNLGNIRF